MTMSALSPTTTGRQRPRSTTRSKTLLATTLAMFFALVLGAGTANAATTVVASNSGGAHWRSCASTSCGDVVSDGYLPNGTQVYMLCWWDGQTVSPPNSDYTSSRWFKVGLPYNNHVGFIHSSLIDNQTNVPHCGSGSV